MYERLNRLYYEKRIPIYGLIKAVNYSWITKHEYHSITGFIYPNTEYTEENNIID